LLQHLPPGVPMDTAGKPLDAEGLPEGSVFGVTNIETEQIPDPEAETNLRLKLKSKNGRGVAIDHSKLRIMVCSTIRSITTKSWRRMPTLTTSG